MLIVSNWKAYVEKKEQGKALFEAAKKLGSKGKHTLVLAPSAPQLALLASGNKSKVAFAAQNISVSTGGASTGEITGSTYKDAGASYAIIGHSERRAMGETNEIVAGKVQHSFAQGLIPIVCVGEKERDADAQYLQELRHQIASIFSPLSPKERLGVVLAYEPVWAIGPNAAGVITKHDLEEMVLYIRKVISDFMPGRANEKTTILYGGSVDASNSNELTVTTGVDGLLVGRASTNVSTYSALLNSLS